MSHLPKNDARKPLRVGLAPHLEAFTDNIPLLHRHFEAQYPPISTSLSQSTDYSIIVLNELEVLRAWQRGARGGERIRYLLSSKSSLSFFSIPSRLPGIVRADPLPMKEIRTYGNCRDHYPFHSLLHARSGHTQTLLLAIIGRLARGISSIILRLYLSPSSSSLLAATNLAYIVCGRRIVCVGGLSTREVGCGGRAGFRHGVQPWVLHMTFCTAGCIAQHRMM
jgi:hypothetical protein